MTSKSIVSTDFLRASNYRLPDVGAVDMTSVLEETFGPDAPMGADEWLRSAVGAEPDIETATDENIDAFDPLDVLKVRSYNIADSIADAGFDGNPPASIMAFHERTIAAVRLNGEGSISNGGGPVGQALSPEERKRRAEEKAEDDRDWLDAQLDQADRKREQMRREQEQWDRTQHSFAGQTLTGKEWAQLAEDFKKGGQKHDWLIDYLMQRGETREQAEQTAHDMELDARGMSKPEGQRTQEERDAADRIKDNPHAASAYEASREVGDSNFTPLAQQNAVETRAGQSASVDAGADRLDAYRSDIEEYKIEQRTAYEQFATRQFSAAPIGAVAMQELTLQSRASVSANDAAARAIFPSAPNLVEHHQAALKATEPLDAQKPEQIAAAAPQAAASAGLDV